MTDPARLPGMPPRPPQVQATPGLVARWKLEEPARLYLWGLAVVALVALTVAGVVSGQWEDYWLHVAGVLGLLVPGAAAVRASVYSPASVVRTLAEIRDRL